MEVVNIKRNDITVRELNFKQDLSEVVALCNKSFPLEINVEHFAWKHLENPFGQSYGFIAIEDGKLVGLRMFMKWNFFTGTDIIHAVRPVDTCTHPSYRGKGIFKKLTLRGLEETQYKRDLVFNTPNANSIGGYLKMGWSKVDRPFLYQISFINPFLGRKDFQLLANKETINDLPIENHNGQINTHLSEEYLRWRYKYSKYQIAQFDDKTIVVFKVEKLKGLKNLILLEVRGAKDPIFHYLNSIALKSSIPLIYSLKNNYLGKAEFPFSITRGSQNVVFAFDTKDLIKNINFSAGDLEGIL